MASRRNAKRKKGTKTDFVRSLPADMPAKDVVARAKEAGFVVSVPYVYNIRTASNARARRSTITPVIVGNVDDSALGSGEGFERAESLLRAIAAELGLSRAIGLLQAEQARVRAVIGAAR